MSTTAKISWTVYTAEGVTAEVSATTITKALKQVVLPEGATTIVAVVASDCVVARAPGALTALVVRHSAGGAS